MTEERQKISFIKRTDVLVLLALLLAALVLWLWLRPKGEAGAVARVSVFKGEEQSMLIALTQEGVHQIEGADLPVQLEVQEGRIRFVNSVCPDHDCEGFGWLQRDGEWAACLPAGVSVAVEE